MNSKYNKIQLMLDNLKQPDYRYKQIADAIFKKRIGEFERMTSLPMVLRKTLVNELGNSIVNIKPVLKHISAQAEKVLFSISDEKHIESVHLKYKRGWESYCISSQCGCGFGCSFCATGTIGLKRNLTVDEITDQLLYFHLNGHNLDSVSFMGMGEALANPNVFDALSILTEPGLFGLSQRRITISTIGVLPGIQKITQDFPQVNLTFSLHSPFDFQRSELMPVNKQYPLYEVMKGLDNHLKQTGRKVYIAYILLRGINDTSEHAKAVAELLRGRGYWEHLYHVDLIPYNSTDKTFDRYYKSERKSVINFARILKAKGVNITIRNQFGSDIGAACGQLYGSTE